MIVVSGEALMDVFAAGETPTGVMLDARIGGSPFNVAVGLARLGQPAAFFGGVAADFLGRRLLQALRAEGVNTDCTATLAAPATLSLVSLDAAGVPAYAFYGNGAADRQLPPSALAAVPPAAAAYQFGSYAMVVEPVATTLRALVERECGRSVVAYDPNIRLNVEPDLARWRDALAWMLPRTTLLKISDEDLGLLYPGADAARLAADWLAAGVALVVVTRGGAGAWAWTARDHIAAEPVAVTVVDTVGAGDTFQAALLAALAERQLLTRAGLAAIDAAALREVLAFATRAAAITCSRRGADLPRRAELPR
ncbi:MAG: carbohydrate kinase [Burkholderiales bacterium]|nr:carbohydrate kinase [Burkholderiales bacterium]